MLFFTDLPGVPKDEIDVTINNGFITLKGERKRSKESEDAWGTHLSERAHGKVTRTLRLPMDADFSNATASFDFGVLKITIPKLSGVGVGAKKLLIS